jgi:hypothetical protein
LPVYVPFSFFLFGAAVPISFSSKSDLEITQIHVKLVSKWRRKGINEKITRVLQSAGNLLVSSKFTIRSWLKWSFFFCREAEVKGLGMPSATTLFVIDKIL